MVNKLIPVIFGAAWRLLLRILAFSLVALSIRLSL
jgi:hypothetical protein